MKFTEEQYQKIVSAWDFEDTYAEATQAVIDVISVFVTELFQDEAQDEALALVNPLTREWAYEQFVEKEKKYYWTSKKSAVNDVNKKTRIYREEVIGALLTYTLAAHDHQNINEEEQLTESEIKEWGYNPEMFNKEEVE